ncbi:unnamed protein product [Ascophyllum nodosum]
MAPGMITWVALLVLVQDVHVAHAFSLNGFEGAPWRSQRSARVTSPLTSPSMVAVSPEAKPMTREEKRKQERLENERRRKFVTPPEQYSHLTDSTPTTEHLIGEEMVNDDESASKLADRCIAEAERLFASDDGWTKVLEEDGIFVESKDVHGPYLKSGVRIVRGLGAIDADADTFFDFQVSREGFQCIDEYLENHRNVDRHEWITNPSYENNKDYELMTNRVEWGYPTKTREFVALDIVDRPRKILISKSSLHPDRPGGSRYQTHTPLDETDYVRAVQYYASKVEPLPDGKCLLRMVTWGEMCDSYTAFWINKFNAHVFITPKYQRFRRVMGGESMFQLSNIVEEAWKLPKLLMIKPDHAVAKGSNFVENLRNKGIQAAAEKKAKAAAAAASAAAAVSEELEA